MSQFSNYTNLIADTTRRLRQVPGMATQLYAETVIGSYIQEGYEILRKEAWWPWMMRRLYGDLNGTTGTVSNSNLWAGNGLVDFDDIRAIYLDGYQQRLPVIDESVNPAAYNGMQFARYVEPIPYQEDPSGTYLFRVYPLTTTGKIHIWARCVPPGLFDNPAVVVPMNKYLLMNYTMWRYMTDDAANPGAAAAALQAYEKLKDQEFAKVNSQPIWLDPGHGQTSDQWMER